MKVKGLSFSPKMVMALLYGRKTQTRRVLKQQPLPDWNFQGLSIYGQPLFHPYGKFDILTDEMEAQYDKWDGLLPKLRYEPGDLIYVREALERGRDTRTRATCFYLATDTDVPAPCEAQSDVSGRAIWLWKGNKLNPSQMPRWASRLTLEVTAVKIERLQDISEYDACHEGIEYFENECGDCQYRPPGTDHRFVKPVEAYRALWETLYGKRSWDANPWVIATSFTVIEQNIEEVLAERNAALSSWDIE